MGKFTVKAPDGSEYDVNAPDGATQADAIEYVKRETAAGRLKPKAKPAGTRYTNPVQQVVGESHINQKAMDKPLQHPGQSAMSIMEGMDAPYRAIGNAVMDATNSPALATAAYTLPQFIGPTFVATVIDRAVKTGKVAAEHVPAFKKILEERLAKEGVTGIPKKGPLADPTPEQIDKIIEAMGKSPKPYPSKAVQTPRQQAGKAKQSVTPEEITGVKGADDLGDVDVGRPPEPKLGATPGEAEKAIPATEFDPARQTMPDLPDPRPEPAPVGTKPVKPARKTARINYNNDSLLTAIKKLGGIKTSHALDIAGEKGFRASSGNAGLWKKDGKGIDDMVAQLADEGYIPAEALNDVDGGVQWLRDAIRGEIDGHKVFSARGDESVIFGRMRDEQGGKIDPMLATRIGTTTAGALAGAGLDPDNPWHGALLGAAGGYGLGHIVSRRVISGGFGSALKVADNPGKILHDAKEAEIAAGQRAATQVYNQLRQVKLTPDRGFAVIRAIETGDVSALSPQEKSVAQLFSTEVGRLGMAAQEAGVIQNLRRNYAPLLFDWNDRHTRAALLKMGANDPARGERVTGFSTFTPFQLERTITDYGMAQRLGLKPATTDPAELFRRYASSVIRATENKRAITELVNMRDATGRPLVALEKGAPRDFVPINKGDTRVPELDGYMVDPDIADSVRAGLTSYDPSVIARSAMAVSWFGKRFNVSLSAFHPMALLQAHAGAGGNPFDVLAGAAARGAEKVTGKTIPYQSAVDKALEAYRMGGQNDAVDVLIRNGLKVEAPIEDRSGRDAFQATAKLIADKADSLVPGGGLLPKGLAAVDSGLQHFTWDYMYTGMKLSTGMKMLEQEVQRNMKAAAEGKEALRPVNEIAADVSSFVNATFGGLNLRRIAEDVAKQWGGKAGSAAYMAASPRGQAFAQIAFFAPDWKISTLQAWTRGLGITGNETVQRFHREYLIRSAFMSLVLADAVNMKLSGHHVWQNDFHTKRGHKQTAMEKVHDATYVDLGDGRKMQMFKHLMEGPHAVADPQKFALNALGFLPRTVGTMVENKQWLTPDWAPPIAENYLSTAERAYRYATWPLREAMPISSMGLDASGGAGIGGFVGTPIYGMTAEQKAKLAAQRMQEKARALGNK